MMAKLTDKLPEGEQWTYEVKWDGYRALLLKSGDRARLVSRNENDLTATYPAIEDAGRRLTAETAILDGEIVALDRNGKPSFQALQHRSAHRDYAIVFYAFDLLHLNGEDQTRLPLTERRKRFRFAGKVRAGFTPHLRREVFESLKPLASATCPFAAFLGLRTDKRASEVRRDA